MVCSFSYRVFKTANVGSFIPNVYTTTKHIFQLFALPNLCSRSMSQDLNLHIYIFTQDLNIFKEQDNGYNKSVTFCKNRFACTSNIRYTTLLFFSLEWNNPRKPSLQSIGTIEQLSFRLGIPHKINPPIF
jgi:hypothetical protein